MKQSNCAHCGVFFSLAEVLRLSTGFVSLAEQTRLPRWTLFVCLASAPRCKATLAVSPRCIKLSSKSLFGFAPSCLWKGWQQAACYQNFPSSSSSSSSAALQPWQRDAVMVAGQVSVLLPHPPHSTPSSCSATVMSSTSVCSHISVHVLHLSSSERWHPIGIQLEVFIFELPGIVYDNVVVQFLPFCSTADKISHSKAPLRCRDVYTQSCVCVCVLVIHADDWVSAI